MGSNLPKVIGATSSTSYAKTTSSKSTGPSRDSTSDAATTIGSRTSSSNASTRSTVVFKNSVLRDNVSEPRATAEDKAPEPTLALVPRASQYPYPKYEEGPSEIKALPAPQGVVQNEPQEYTAPFISYEIAPKLSLCVTMANNLAQELARLPFDHALNVRQFFANRCEDARNGTARIRPFESPAPTVWASQV